jgi:cellulose biosynthesis protein BcsQ
MLQQLCGHFELEMCDPIRVNIDLAEAFGYQQSIFEYAPHSRGARDYTRLIDRVEAGLTVRAAAGAGPRTGEVVPVA